MFSVQQAREEFYNPMVVSFLLLHHDYLVGLGEFQADRWKEVDRIIQDLDGFQIGVDSEVFFQTKLLPVLGPTQTELFFAHCNLNTYEWVNWILAEGTAPRNLQPAEKVCGMDWLVATVLYILQHIGGPEDYASEAAEVMEPIDVSIGNALHWLASLPDLSWHRPQILGWGQNTNAWLTVKQFVEHRSNNTPQLLQDFCTITGVKMIANDEKWLTKLNKSYQNSCRTKRWREELYRRLPFCNPGLPFTG